MDNAECRMLETEDKQRQLAVSHGRQIPTLCGCQLAERPRGKMADMNVAYSPEHGLGEEQSIWFKLTPLLNQENPMQVLMALSDKYGGVIPINLKNQRVILLSEPAHAQRVLVDNADNYTKYFDGLRPIFGKSMITVDGALWQKIRAPQQPAFHPNMFEVYLDRKSTRQNSSHLMRSRMPSSA